MPVAQISTSAFHAHDRPGCATPQCTARHVPYVKLFAGARTADRETPDSGCSGHRGDRVARVRPLTDPDTYAAPPIVQIGRLDGGVVIYSRHGFRPVERLHALSRKGVAAAFTTTVELDTSIAVARNGQQIREFDPFFYDEEVRQGALPQEHDVDFSDDMGFPAAWTFLDRVTRLHCGARLVPQLNSPDLRPDRQGLSKTATAERDRRRRQRRIFL